MSITSYTAINQLPTTIPLFPLQNVLLLPHNHLPLNIFEPRYTNMIDHALKTDRLIGIIQIDGDGQQSGELKSLYKTGCVGKITSLHETDDARYEIVLTGLNRFHLGDQKLQESGFICADVDYNHYKTDLKPETDVQIDLDHIRPILKRYFMINDLQCSWEKISNCKPQMLINALSMICPFTSEEKQALLECEDTKSRASSLISLLEMSIAANDSCIAQSDAQTSKH